MIEEKSGVYKCDECGNIVEVLVVGGADIVCCGEKMRLLVANTEDAANEKHVPVISIDGDNVTVKVGSVAHPMEEGHWIEIIEILRDGMVVAAARLNPGDEPEAVFCLEDTHGISARELCNIHGLWATE